MVAINVIAVGAGILIAGLGVVALQYLSLSNGHHGARADIMSAAWVVFVTGALGLTVARGA